MIQVSYEQPDIEEQESKRRVSNFPIQLSKRELIIPERFSHFQLKEISELTFGRSPNHLSTNSLILDNIVIEYKDCADKLELLEVNYVSRVAQITYLQSYVSVGMPTGNFNRLVKDMDGEFTSPYSWQDEDYTWFSALLKDNDQRDIPQCYVYNEVSKNTRAVGNIHDVLTGLKSSVKGAGRFKIRTANNFIGQRVLSFLLTGFEITDLTKEQSNPRPRALDPPSNRLLEALKDLKL